MQLRKKESPLAQPVSIPLEKVTLEGDLVIPDGAKTIVLFAHGSGSSRHSTRNRYVASVLNEQNMGTLLADLLTIEEEKIDERTRHLRFDIPMLAKRLAGITDWLGQGKSTKHLDIAYFGASTGAAAALIAAAQYPDVVKAVVSRGGRPDLAGGALQLVRAPVLLIVGENDPEVLTLNEQALQQLNDRSRLEIVPKATHLFEEAGTLEAAAELAAAWFKKHME
jgi:pimeloyl-ACP methyl ester carboxylesterase